LLAGVTVLQPSTPIIVEVVKQPATETTVVDILLGAIGLTGVLVVAGAVLGGLLGGVLIWFRVIRPRSLATPASLSEHTGLGLDQAGPSS
jgi:hypothetical protein